ncbi:PREDICTED: WAT1-related protein At5g07050 [Theobroma cacao]|uniref:WAT1-related protein n=1 Tax=Theobroma cacao TaxID=3641 RepID=A0AB32W0X5_THECC|nr:PREDICTED: WAT1-related protein At5g07050 [Theobroma cacao]
MLTSMKMETQQQGETAGGIKRKGELRFEGLKPYAICIFCNICFAGYNIISKVSLDNGMSSYVLVVYGPVFGTLITAVLALLFERKHDRKISMAILRDIFFLGILGAVLGRTLFYIGLKDTSPAVASALANLIPSMTFVLAVLCRMEALDMSKHSARAKVGGSVVALAGATLMTLYKGCALISPHSHHTQASSKLQFNKDWIKGSLMLLLSYLSLSAFLVLQTVTVKKYPAPITLTSLTCLTGTLVSAIMTAAVDHKASSWRLSWDMSLVAILYRGIVIFGLTFYLQALVGKTKGLVFMTAFRPLGTVIATIMGLLVLGDALFLGRVVGALLIVVGLCLTLWGKEKEKEKKLLEGTHLLNALKSDQKSDNTWIL